MPGNKLYRISRMLDKVGGIWNWGTIAQAKYHLGLSDKYLVEAKTLFEYQQYLLAQDALKRSDLEIQRVGPSLIKAREEGKDVTALNNIFISALSKHQEELRIVKEAVPSEFVWRPEKSMPTSLPLGALIDASISLREELK